MDKQMKEVFEERDVSAKVFPEGATDAEVVAAPSRRSFSTSYKRRIVREADACNASGAVGALLRREGLYSSHLSHWRVEIEAIDTAALEHKPRGPKPNDAKLADRRVAALELQNAKLIKKLNRAEQIIEAQKKLCNLLGLPTEEDLPR
jgi:transposase